MGHSSHRGTTGHTIGSQIIGKDSGTGKNTSSDPDSQSGQTLSGFSRLEVKPSQNNGFAVSHSPIPKGESGKEQIGHPETPVQEQMHVFRSAEEAHNHIGTLLGVRMASGAQEV